jgi:hypothetical protein
MKADIYVKPAMRDWILVGFAEGTAGYNTFSGNQVSLNEDAPMAVVRSAIMKG